MSIQSHSSSQGPGSVEPTQSVSSTQIKATSSYRQHAQTSGQSSLASNGADKNFFSRCIERIAGWVTAIWEWITSWCRTQPSPLQQQTAQQQTPSNTPVNPQTPQTQTIPVPVVTGSVVNPGLVSTQLGDTQTGHVTNAPTPVPVEQRIDPALTKQKLQETISNLINTCLDDDEYHLDPFRRHEIYINFYLTSWTGGIGGLSDHRCWSQGISYENQQILGQEPLFELSAIEQEANWLKGDIQILIVQKDSSSAEEKFHFFVAQQSWDTRNAQFVINSPQLFEQSPSFTAQEVVQSYLRMGGPDEPRFTQFLQKVAVVPAPALAPTTAAQGAAVEPSAESIFTSIESKLTAGVKDGISKCIEEYKKTKNFKPDTTYPVCVQFEIKYVYNNESKRTHNEMKVLHIRNEKILDFPQQLIQLPKETSVQRIISHASVMLIEQKMYERDRFDVCRSYQKIDWKSRASSKFEESQNSSSTPNQPRQDIEEKFFKQTDAQKFLPLVETPASNSV
jgi:hypothetical protein